MVLAFTRLTGSEDIILVQETKRRFCIEWRDSLVPKETLYYGDEDEAYENFEKASGLLERAMEERRKREVAEVVEQTREARGGNN
jgi:hypothetical protein